MLGAAIIDEYGFKEGLSIKGKEILTWPYGAPRPSKEEIDTLISQYRNKNKEKMTSKPYQRAIKEHLNEIARTKGYDNEITCASYTNSTNMRWKNEANAFIAWRDAVFIYALAEIKKIVNQTRPIPTLQEFIQELPVINWGI